ncbi:hypothetical protein GGX14DRAFT_388581 [Mycena pura]|uniref:Uncharacterized protein n=1 Tax=Mycena pura TaxID=153505 RepID=A0AAD6VSG6_9AGAR|nr:hypothetical protein GGX14DRAFT_388581 [Mycena pura]
MSQTQQAGRKQTPGLEDQEWLHRAWIGLERLGKGLRVLVVYQGGSPKHWHIGVKDLKLCSHHESALCSRMGLGRPINVVAYDLEAFWLCSKAFLDFEICKSSQNLATDCMEEQTTYRPWWS